MLDARPAAQPRTDVSVLLVADRPEAGLAAAVASVLASLDAAARGGAGPAGGRLRGDRLGGELVLAVRDVAALPVGVPCSDPRLRVVAVPGAGGGRARNLATGAARGRYLLLTTPDARVPERWVAAMVEPLRTGHADLVAGTSGAARAEGASGAAPDVPGGTAASDAFPAASCGASRAVLETLGFDDALGAGRSPDAAVTTVFRADAVSAGFRARAVVDVPVDLPAARRDGRAAAAARDRGRTDAYLDRHVRTGPSPRGRVAALVALARGVLRLAGATCAGDPDARWAARAEVARDREAARLCHVPDRDRPRAAAGDLPGGPGGARSAAPAVLVARSSVPPTALPVPPPVLPVPPVLPGAVAAVAADPQQVDGPARGAAHLLWPSSRAVVLPPAGSPRAAADPR